MQKRYFKVKRNLNIIEVWVIGVVIEIRTYSMCIMQCQQLNQNKWKQSIS